MQNLRKSAILDKSVELEGRNDDSDENPVHPKWIITHTSSQKIYWDLFIISLAIWNAFAIPIEVAFHPAVL